MSGLRWYQDSHYPDLWMADTASDAISVCKVEWLSGWRILMWHYDDNGSHYDKTVASVEYSGPDEAIRAADKLFEVRDDS